MRISHVEKAEGPVRWIEVNNEDNSETDTFLDLGPSESMYKEMPESQTLLKVSGHSAQRIREAADRFKF